MSSPQTLSEADRRLAAAWAADCAERVLGLFRLKYQVMTALTLPSPALGRSPEGSWTLPAASLAAPDRPEAVDDEIRWQLTHMTAEVRTALGALPPVGKNRSGPLGPGLLASGQLGTIIRDLQSGLAQRHQSDPS